MQLIRLMKAFPPMNKALPLAASLLLIACAASAADVPARGAVAPAPKAEAEAGQEKAALFTPESVASEGSVTVEGTKIDYKAVGGTLIVHPKGWDDAARPASDAKGEEKASAGPEAGGGAEASMFYVAYFKKGVPAAGRPITFLYNGGPGSPTVWLHMGAFGPRRVVTKDGEHTPAAPYRLVDNAYSLLDASDLVFIDAPGTGFSRIAGKDKEKAFWGVDPDAHAFEQFIIRFLGQYGRWNSPKYLFGESYGTPRSAVVVSALETDQAIDFNGVILLSQILNFDLSVDGPQANPGTDQAYITALPTYAATAWYHNKVAGGRPADLEAFVKEAEAFAIGDYAAALQAGAALDPARRQATAERLSHFTGLPVPYLLKADLRVNGGMFEKMLQEDQGLTTGRLDTRFAGPDIDPLSKEADYDPQSAGLSSAYVSSFNDYARNQLGYGAGKIFKPHAEIDHFWSFDHQQPGQPEGFPGPLNVMPDLAVALKVNPTLKIMVTGGYYDLATPFYEGWYEMHHLPVQAGLQGNIEYHYYPSGHMVYANEASLKSLHDDTAAFIRKTDNLP
jgi:carboxypeptidase C (cathepsin A)